MSSSATNDSHSTPPGASSHLVFLIPGLLGFDSFAVFSYFADRACAALRAGLEARLHERTTVIPLPVPPLDSLAERQACLLRSLINRTNAHSPHRAPHIHLIGHSTGGVDALLLTRKAPLAAQNWQDLDTRAPEFLAAIQSVVTLASPHQGACIAKDPVAALLRARSLRDVLQPRALESMPSVGKFLFNIAKASLRDSSTKEVLAGALLAKLDTARYVQQVIRGGALVEDLQPGKGSGRVSEPGAFRAGIYRRSYVTVAHAPEPGVVGSGYPDELFRDVSQRASGYTTGCTDEGDRVEASVQRLQRAAQEGQVPIIRNARAQLPRHLNAGHNDGVVNSARQLFDPNDERELAAIVIGDHYDVIGHYDRTLWATDAGGDEVALTVNSGLLHSGSGFSDEQFFALWGSIAETIASAAIAAQREGGAREEPTVPHSAAAVPDAALASKDAVIAADTGSQPTRQRPARTARR